MFYSLTLTILFLQGPNALTVALVAALRADARLFLVPGAFGPESTFVRLAVCSPQAESRDMRFAYDVVAELAARILRERGPDPDA